MALAVTAFVGCGSQSQENAPVSTNSVSANRHPQPIIEMTPTIRLAPTNNQANNV